MAIIEARSPLTGQIIRVYDEADNAAARQAMERARGAFASWKDQSVAMRARHLGNLKKAVLGGLDEIVRQIVLATGKVDLEAQSSDVWATLDIMQYYQEHAEKILAMEQRPSSPLFMGAKFRVEYRPIGVIAVFSPWNFPFQLAMVPLVSALMAGNAVILKPSEITPSVGELIGDLCGKAGLPSDLVQVLYGGKNAGQSLIEAMPDKIFFTGSLATGREIMRAAAAGPVPVELELSGKDPMIVFEDAGIERAANAAVYGAFANAGQICVSVERCYVQETIHDRFVSAVARKTKMLRVGRGDDADIGAITSPRQLEIIRNHIKDALDKGAELIAGGTVDGNFHAPTVLTKVNHTMKVMTEETFGPILPIMPFSTEKEAIGLANDSIYGLNAAIFTKDAGRARRVAGMLEVGNCAVNDVYTNIANPFTPFGGVKRSGFGRYHGPEGLRTFCSQVTIMVSALNAKRQPNWFPYNARARKITRSIIDALYGDHLYMKPVKGLLRLLQTGREG